jgi:hypothetical protein
MMNWLYAPPVIMKVTLLTPALADAAASSHVLPLNVAPVEGTPTDVLREGAEVSVARVTHDPGAPAAMHK